MAIWVAEGTERPENIRGTAPRATVDPDGSVTPLTAAEALWRDFVLNVQTHECTRQCLTPPSRDSVSRRRRIERCLRGA